VGSFIADAADARGAGPHYLLSPRMPCEFAFTCQAIFESIAQPDGPAFAFFDINTDEYVRPSAHAAPNGSIADHWEGFMKIAQQYKDSCFYAVIDAGKGKPVFVHYLNNGACEYRLKVASAAHSPAVKTASGAGKWVTCDSWEAVPNSREEILS
jgi:hypothetical protein